MHIQYPPVMIIQPLPISEPVNNGLIPARLLKLSCGFPSPADDYQDAPIDLHKHLIKRPSATYFAWANGDSLVELGIFDGDLLIVDRSLEPRHGDVVVASLDGELCCKVLDLNQRKLLAANGAYAAIAIPDDLDVLLEGVVIHAVHHLRCD